MSLRLMKPIAGSNPALISAALAPVFFIGGTIVAYPDFTAQTSGTTSFSDGYGNTWLASGTALVDDKHYRFTGSMTTLPQRWDVSGNDVYVPVECSGVTRRLNQGNNPVDSVLTNSLPNIGAGLVASRAVPFVAPRERA